MWYILMRRRHKTAYEPTPIDTSNVVLSSEVLQLAERLAMNAHDVWGARRMAEGWVYGPERDDEAKTHPDLVYYHDLPEGEKEYDRSTAMETLRAIVHLGFQIIPPGYVVIQAFQMTLERRWDNSEWPQWLHMAWNKDPAAGPSLWIDPNAPIATGHDSAAELVCGDIDSRFKITWGDWIVRDFEGGIYACKPENFPVRP